ncbi:MAG: ThuA domain-containing protein, partial [SAR202 cluster bacterium]|nr:ThuA domain-containing protein [SAR202 cluster bacterium]
MKLLVITGGRHPYEESTPVLERFLKAAGHDVTATEDASVLADSTAMAGYDALVFNTRRENAADFAEMKLSEAAQNGIIDYVKAGKGFVCLHISGCGADYWPEFAEITGGGWVSGTSYHPPYSNFAVKVSQPGHAGVAGVSDFNTDDELYMGIEYKSGSDVYLTGTSEEGTWP